MIINNPTYKRHLHIVSSTTGSIGHITNNLIPFFRKHFHVTLEQEGVPFIKDILLCHFLQPEIVKHPIFDEFKTKILIQPIDGDVLKLEYRDLINKFDIIIVPSTGNKKILLNNNIIKPIYVIPNFYKEDIFILDVKTPLTFLPKNSFVFYHESTFHYRKNTGVMIEAFVKAFSSNNIKYNTVLLLKDSEVNHITFEKNEKLKKNIAAIQAQYKYPAKIFKITQHLEEETLKNIWHNIDCYVGLSNVEGFGIPFLNFAILNKPIMYMYSETNGYMDFLNDKIAYEIPSFRVKANKEFMWLYNIPEVSWEYCNVGDVINMYRTIYDDCMKGKEKRASASDKYSLHNIAQEYINLLLSCK